MFEKKMYPSSFKTDSQDICEYTEVADPSTISPGEVEHGQTEKGVDAKHLASSLVLKKSS
jgi:hypothetical protein